MREIYYIEYRFGLPKIEWWDWLNEKVGPESQDTWWYCPKTPVNNFPRLCFANGEDILAFRIKFGL